ncbi:MAG TPA: glucose 1-dehydrogenase [Candidatus Bathyarchaeia archaeon]|nr:glucose 1-dehydrogenase [Candidatus Bathyarchaeia archaeon]
MELDGMVAIVTGGSSGIGRAIAELFAIEGAKTVIGDVKPNEELLGLIREKNGAATFVKVDVRSDLSVRDLIDKTISAYGGINIVCNCAGIELVKPLIDTDEEEWNRVIDTNLKGPYLLSKYAIRHMFGRRNANIVNIASQLGVVGGEQFTAYSASKGGVILLTKSTALEYARNGIRVNCICPGAVDTPMVDREVLIMGSSPEEARGRFVSKHPIGRLGKPKEIAEAALFLASERASFITGASLVVDGGYLAQ